jgi:hypothetical protein
MKKVLLTCLLIFFSSSLLFSQTLDQSNTIISASTSGVSIGQSFTAGITGNLSKFIYFNNTVSSNTYPLNFKLKVYQGGGNTGVLLGEQSFTLTSATPNGEFEINISSTINVTAGNLYTAYFIPDDGTSPILFSSTAANSYSGGSLYNGNSPFVPGELYFKTFVSVPATHLNFAGDNDYVILSNESNFDFLGNEMTVEFWMKSDVTNPDQWDALITKGDDSWRIHLNNSGTINCAFNGTTANFNSTIPVTDGNWHHISVTLGGNMASLYIDGSLNTSTSFSGTLNNSSFPVAIGQNLQQNVGRFFTGDIEDVRFWNIARTASQINASKNCELQGAESGLVAYYKFNQGIDAGTNTGVTTLTDATTNANNGTLTNFALTGSTSNWLAGSPVTTGSVIPSAATVTTPVTYTQNDTASPLTATTGANGTGLLWYTTATGGTSSTTAPTPSTATVGSTSYWVSSTNANGCESERTEIVVTVNAAPGTHLNFDGVNDRIDCGNSSSVQITGSNITLEAIIRLNSFATFPNEGNIINKEQNSPDNGYMLRVGGSGIVNFIFGNGSWNEINSPVNAVQLNTWHHVVGTHDGATMKIYVDGIMVASQASTSSIGNSTSNLFIGDWPSGGRNLDGDIDEVRIWNVTRTDAQIQNGINCELQNSQTGLVSYYKFNQGNSGASNTSVTTLTDASGNSNNGTLSGFALNGTTSNWLAGSPIITGMPCATLNTSNFELAEMLKLYPNPTKGNITILLSTREKSNISMYDINGRLLFNAVKTTSNYTLDLSGYNTGIYILKINVNGSEIIRKVIKE